MRNDAIKTAFAITAALGYGAFLLGVLSVGAFKNRYKYDGR